MRVLISLFFMLPALLSAQNNACLTRSKEYFTEKNYPAVESILKKCLSKSPSNTDYLISLGGVEMLLGKFNTAQSHFKTALNLLDSNSPYIAYVNSRLGDISMHNADLTQATKYYDAALLYEPANINALVGRGICYERMGHKTEAATFFKKALAVDFTNIVARERLISLEPFIMTDEELLRALRERNIIDPIASTFTQEDRLLFNKVHKAEENNGIEYLSIKYENKIPPGFIVERDSGKLYVRKMLTLTGYKEVIAQLSKEARQLFLSKGIEPGTIFELRDFDGQKIFDNTGDLTDEGLNVYTRALLGSKGYLLPNESLPRTQKQIDALAKKYLNQGYEEISIPEFLALMKETRCSEYTLVRDLKMQVINIDTKNKRVFVVAHGNRAVHPFILPYEFVQKNRADKKNNQREFAPIYSSTFGTGKKDPIKLCKPDGSLFSF